MPTIHVHASIQEVSLSENSKGTKAQFETPEWPLMPQQTRDLLKAQLSPFRIEMSRDGEKWVPLPDKGIDQDWAGATSLIRELVAGAHYKFGRIFAKSGEQLLRYSGKA